MLFLIIHSACFKKSNVPVAPIGPTRTVFLPFNLQTSDKDLQWIALAAPILMAEVSEQSPDLVAVPFWEAMPTVIQSAGASRIFTEESVASIANWLTAKWATLGEISSARAGVSIIVDFIPARSNQVPFRYLKTGRVNSMESYFHEAFRQFLRYLAARPLEPGKRNDLSMNSVRALAAALDREYGWFVDADPGKAQQVVADLARSDERLARILFNPNLYPVLAQTK